MGFASRAQNNLQTVILVDDMKSAFTLPSMLFKSWGYNVVSLQAGKDFYSPEELKEKIKSNNPFLVITDHQMGTMSGLDTLKAAHAVNPDLPVVVHSTELEKIPGYPDITGEGPGKFKGAYSKDDRQRFKTIATSLGMNTERTAMEID